MVILWIEFLFGFVLDTYGLVLFLVVALCWVCLGCLLRQFC